MSAPIGSISEAGVIALLRERLTIRISKTEEYRGCDVGYSPTLTVQLLLDGEVISESTP